MKARNKQIKWKQKKTIKHKLKEIEWWTQKETIKHNILHPRKNDKRSRKSKGQENLKTKSNRIKLKRYEIKDFNNINNNKNNETNNWSKKQKKTIFEEKQLRSKYYNRHNK